MWPSDNPTSAGTSIAAAGATPKWIKVGNSLPYTDFQTAATTKTNTLVTLPAGGIVHATKIKQSTAFAGTLITAVTASAGNAGTADKYASDFDILQAVSATAFELSQAVGSESHTAGVALKVTLTSTGANLSALTAGVLDIWMLVSIAK